VVKRFIAYILFGVAAVNIITASFTTLIFLPLYERLGIPLTATRMALISTDIISIVIGIVLIIIGIVILIKSRKE
jgi:uncharacterized membrane protein